jgi:hypothetical protein
LKEEEIGSEASTSPQPELYLEYFRVHCGAIDVLFKACPPQQWGALSSAITKALDEVGKNAGLKVDLHIKSEDKPV